MSFPGIPPLLNKISGLGNKVVLLIADVKLILNLFSNSAPKWGIFKDGKLVIKPDTITRIEVKDDWDVADYPMEGGAFQTYNKINTPRVIHLRMTKGGTIAAKTDFLVTLNKITASLDIYDVYMPEGALKSFTIENKTYSREATQGLGLLTVDVSLRQIMVTVGTTTFSNNNVQQYSGVTPIDSGTLQSREPTPEQRDTAVAGAPGA